MCLVCERGEPVPVPVSLPGAGVAARCRCPMSLLGVPMSLPGVGVPARCPGVAARCRSPGVAARCRCRCPVPPPGGAGGSLRGSRDRNGAAVLGSEVLLLPPLPGAAGGDGTGRDGTGRDGGGGFRALTDPSVPSQAKRSGRWSCSVCGQRQAVQKVRAALHPQPRVLALGDTWAVASARAVPLWLLPQPCPHSFCAGLWAGLGPGVQAPRPEAELAAG